MNKLYINPGSSSWTPFLKDGALRENSPTHIGLV